MLKAELPFLVKMFSYLPFGPAVQAKQGSQRLAIYGQQSLDRYKKQLDLDPENVRPTLLTNEYGLVEDGVLAKGQLLRDGERIWKSGYAMAMLTK